MQAEGVHPVNRVSDWLKGPPMDATAPPLEDRLLSPNEAATYCGISRRTLYRWVGERRFPVIHLRGLTRIRLSDLEAYLRGNTARAIGF